MSDEDNEWKWKDFVKIGNNIQNMRGIVRTHEAMAALNFSDDLLRSKYITDSKERRELHATLLPIIAQYLDANTELIQSAVREYFLVQHCKAGLDETLFDASFSPKMDGIHAGFICDISNGPPNKIRYYAKTHQFGPTESHVESRKPPDIKEIFVYKLLQNIGIGPEAHFIIPSNVLKKSLYIATKECHLVPLSKLSNESMNIKALVQLDLISRILCLQDCTTNSSNCGLVGDRPMIVDFGIETRSHGYFKSEILNGFFQGKGDFEYSGIMETVVGIPEREKRDILKASLREWILLENIEKTLLEVNAFVRKFANSIALTDDLERYAQDVTATVEILAQLH